jgi:hypothetical protein
MPSSFTINTYEIIIKREREREREGEMMMIVMMMMMDELVVSENSEMNKN